MRRPTPLLLLQPAANRDYVHYVHYVGLYIILLSLATVGVSDDTDEANPVFAQLQASDTGMSRHVGRCPHLRPASQPATPAAWTATRRDALRSSAYDSND